VCAVAVAVAVVSSTLDSDLCSTPAETQWKGLKSVGTAVVYQGSSIFKEPTVS
jgi:hypothetical protein